MKRLALLLLLCRIACTPHASAQDHVAVGAYVDYFHLSQTNTNFAGIGARAGFGLGRHVMLEGELNYDFNQAFNEHFTNGMTLTVQRSDVRLLHGLFGPKLSLGHSNFHLFVTAKGGFLDTMFDSRPANLDTFFSSVDNLRAKNVMGVFYPGGGVEGRVGPIGLRLDVGDEMYFNSGTHHNLRVALGPYIRF
jgi:hypothetical protein